MLFGRNIPTFRRRIFYLEAGGCRFLRNAGTFIRLHVVTSPKCMFTWFRGLNPHPHDNYWLDEMHNLHSQTLPWGAVCRSWTLKSRPARSCRNCALSIPSTRSGNRNRWSIPSCGPCCCRCLLVAVGVALDAVSILNKAHLTRTNENRTHSRVPSLEQHEPRESPVGLTARERPASGAP
jgi:hypothetical protein